MLKCQVKHCNNEIFKNRLCRKHFDLKQKGKCTVEGCDGKYFAGEMCAKHYARFKRYGTVHLPKELSLKERLYLSTKRRGECIEWTGSNDGRKGYGVISINGKQEKTHRVSWEIENGPIPEGMCVCHACDNPACINPSHLFIGTHSDNMQDCLQKGRGNRGGPKGENCHFSRLTEKEVLEIRDSDEYCNALAKRYNISTAIITQVQKGQIWKHLPINAKHLGNKSQKLTEADILAIQASNESNEVLQAEYGVSKSTICRVRGKVDHKKSTKLTEKDVLAIRASSERNIDLAKKFNVAPANIYSIRKRVTWKHI